MAITRDDALDYSITHFHFEGDGGCWRKTGPKGGVKQQTIEVRRNGGVQTWKTRPDEFRMPVKYGIRARDQFSVTHNDAWQYHTPDKCPLLQPDSNIPPQSPLRRGQTY